MRGVCVPVSVCLCVCISKNISYYNCIKLLMCEISAFGTSVEHVGRKCVLFHFFIELMGMQKRLFAFGVVNEYL